MVPRAQAVWEPPADVFEDEHEAFRRTVRSFLEREVVPHHQQWEADGQVSREVWTRAGEMQLQRMFCFT